MRLVSLFAFLAALFPNGGSTLRVRLSKRHSEQGAIISFLKICFPTLIPLFVFGDDLINNPVFFRLLCIHDEIALHILLNLFQILAGMFRQ